MIIRQSVGNLTVSLLNSKKNFVNAIHELTLIWISCSQCRTVEYSKLIASHFLEFYNKIFSPMQPGNISLKECGSILRITCVMDELDNWLWILWNLVKYRRVFVLYISLKCENCYFGKLQFGELLSLHLMDPWSKTAKCQMINWN